MSEVRIHRWGLHFGEEPFIVGNKRAGMIVFSGCHLRCRWCYTPEASFLREGEVLDFRSILHQLAGRGAENISLVTPSHVWGFVERDLAEFKSKHSLPLVLKVTGYEGIGLVERFSRIADVVVPDFKVWSEAASIRSGLPRDYGPKTLSAILHLDKQLDVHTGADGKISRGTVIRHLWMPDAELETEWILENLAASGLRARVNFTTRFLAPLNAVGPARKARWMQAPDSWKSRVTTLCEAYGFQAWFDGIPAAEGVHGKQSRQQAG